MARTFRLPLAVALVVVLGSVATAGPASARNQPIAVQPAPGSHTARQIDAVTIVLDKPVKAPYTMVVTGPNGAKASIGEPRVVSTNMALQLRPGLPGGVYEVRFRSQGNREPEGGSYQFVLGDQGAVDYDGIKTWGGFDKVPSSLALAGDDQAAADLARQQASATPTPTPADRTDEAGGTTSDSTRAAADQDDSTADSAATWWPWVLAGLLIAAGAIGAVVVRRRRVTGS